MRKKGDRGGVSCYVSLREVHVVVVRFAKSGDSGDEVVKAQLQLLFVFTRFIRSEVKDQLLGLANLEDTLALIHFEVGWADQLPLSCALANIAKNDRFLVVELDRHESEVKCVGEVEHCARALRTDGHDELLTLSYHH